MAELLATIKQLEELKTTSSLSQYQLDLLKWYKNVDKRYAWLVLAILWTSMAAALGPYRVYSLVYAKITALGVYNRQEASWPFASIFTVENVLGPVTSLIVYHISYRQSMCIGFTMLTIANGFATLSNTLLLDIFLLGGVQGIGYSFIVMPFMEIVNSYFLKYRNIALGFALCGATVSIFGLSPIFQYLLEKYHFRYSYLGISVLTGGALFLMPLLRPNPLPAPPNERNQQNGVKRRQSTFSQLSYRALSYQNSLRRQSSVIIHKMPGQQAESKSLSNRMHIDRQPSVISVNPFASSVGLERRISRAINEGSRQKKHHSTDDSAKKSSTLVPISSGVEMERFESVSQMNVDPSGSVDLATIKGVLKTPAFHFIWYNELVYFWIFSVFSLILVDYGLDRGCSQAEAEYLLSFQSIGEVLGRIVLTVLVDLRYLSNRGVVIIVLLIISGFLFMITQVTGFFWIAFATVAINAFSSLQYIMLNGLLVDYLGEDKVTLGYGMGSCIGGFFMAFRPLAVGYFRDYHGSYDMLMVSLAVATAIGALQWVLEPFVTRMFRGRGSDEVERQSVDGTQAAT